MSQRAWLAIEFLVWVGLGVLLDALLQGAAGVPRARATRGSQRVTQLAVAGLVGLGVGIASGLAFPDRLLTPRAFPGVSLVIVPLLLGAIMHLWGVFEVKHGRASSALATWYGGATLGATLAVGRLLLVQ